MSKKFNCIRKIQDREFQRRLAKNAFNAHRKFTGCDVTPMTIEEKSSMVAVSLMCVHVVKQFVETAKKK